MTNIKLSICMPTYNFGKFIGETLDSIIPQLTDEVEIVIVDGASTDNTEQIVQDYQKKNSHIRYYRLDARGGIDKDMLRSVELASGEYCWLFSSDDVMKPDAISRILSQIKDKNDVYICGFDLCKLDIKDFLYSYPISTVQKETVFDLSDPAQRKAYFQAAIMTPAFFSFMSANVIKRDSWMKIPLEEQFMSSAWAHVARLFRLIPQGLKVKILPESYLMKRSFNDSFMDKGLVHRLGIAIDGFNQIADTIFGPKSFEAYHLRRSVRNEINFNFRQLIIAQATAASKEERQRLLCLIDKLYCDVPFFRQLVLLLLRVCSPTCCQFMIATRRLFRKKNSEARD